MEMENDTEKRGSGKLQPYPLLPMSSPSLISVKSITNQTKLLVTIHLAEYLASAYSFFHWSFCVENTLNEKTIFNFLFSFSRIVK